MAIALTNSVIRAGTTENSYARGQKYYQEGNILSPTICGNELRGLCRGNSAPYYKVRVVFDDVGIVSTHCTCEYDYGGYCKHVVALMLAYVYVSKDFKIKPPISDLLQGLSLEQTQALLIELVNKHDLYDDLEQKIVNQMTDDDKEMPQKSNHLVDVKAYQKRIELGLKKYDYYDSYHDGDENTAFENELDEICGSIAAFLDTDDLNNAIAIALAVIETVEKSGVAFDEVLELESFYDRLDVLLAECVLHCERMSPTLKQISQKKHLLSRLKITNEAIQSGWDNLTYAQNHPDWSVTKDEPNSYTWNRLVEAQLSVLERQKRTEDYLCLARAWRQTGSYINLLVSLGRYQEAIDYGKTLLESSDEAYELAKQLREHGKIEDAVVIAEHGLNLAGNKKTLASWLGPIEEMLNRKPQAIQAWRIVFADEPSLKIYQFIQTLAGAEWGNIKDDLLAIGKKSYYVYGYIDVVFYEQEWDAAIGCAKHYAADDLKIADGVMSHRAAWVLDYGQKKIADLLRVADSSKYALVADWMRRIKSAYAELGQLDAWRVYLSQIKENYKRRPSLQAQLKSL